MNFPRKDQQNALMQIQQESGDDFFCATPYFSALLRPVAGGDEVARKRTRLMLESDVALPGLHRGVTQQELNLFESASSAMTEMGTSATKIRRCEMGNADSFGRRRRILWSAAIGVLDSDGQKQAAVAVGMTPL